MSFVSFLLLSVAAVLYKVWSGLQIRRIASIKSCPGHATALQLHHETRQALEHLVETDGAGDWPPKAFHGDWPSELQPFHDIYLETIPFLSSQSPSLEDSINIERRNYFRTLMRQKLDEHVNIQRVQQLLSSIEAGDWSKCSRQTYNGFYCCIGVLRHAYRWAVIPLVKVAQDEKIVAFPAQIETTWAHLQRHFGVESDSGSNTSNVLHNYNESGERAYKINVDISPLVTSTEDAFFRMFYDVEVMVRILSMRKKCKMLIR